MATKEKWVELFEQVIGRKPTKEEFLEARNQGFINLPVRSELLDSELPQKAIKKQKKECQRRKSYYLLFL